jgi:hypothetical protein
MGGAEVKNRVDTRRSIRKVSLSDITPFEMWDSHGEEREETVFWKVKT